MEITIIKNDRTVYIDKVSYSDLQINSVPSDVHALQWKGYYGWIEFVEDENGIKPQNLKIDILPDWANDAIEAWNIAKSIEEQQAIEEQNQNTNQ